jgi:MoaA/NifB/PqqE/SkfB family radical SAM enzyme
MSLSPDISDEFASLVVPYPVAVNIQTTTDCNRQCRWCPDVSWRGSRRMPSRTFDKVLQALVEWGYEGEIHPYLMAEPLCDERLYHFVQGARACLPKNYILLTTNGDALWRREVRHSVATCGVNGVQISTYGNEEAVVELVRQWEREEENVVLCEYSWEKRMDGLLRVRVVPFERLKRRYWNRAGNLPGHKKGKKCGCELPWRQMCINWKGNVVLCCGDWGFDAVLGNVCKDKLGAIWNGLEYRMIRRLHLEGRCEDVCLCARCDRNVVTLWERGKAKIRRMIA